MPAGVSSRDREAMETSRKPDHLLVGQPHDPVRWRGWHPARWVALWLGALVQAWVMLYVVAAIFFLHSGLCGEPPYLADVQDGRRALWILLAVVAAPWSLAVLTARRRLRVAIAAVVAVSPVLWGIVDGLRLSAWQASWCLF
jgi:hypothetical protein